MKSVLKTELNSELKTELKSEICNGNGECLIQCECNCYNEETGEYNDKCTCGHRSHNGYCPPNCCKPIKCKNVNCSQHIPMWLFDLKKGCCVNCDFEKFVDFGKKFEVVNL